MNGTIWTDLAPEAHETDRQGWDDWEASGALVRFVRFTGLYGSANQCVAVAELEVYGAQSQARRNMPIKEITTATSVPVAVLTSDGPGNETGWAAVDGDPTTAWVGQKSGGGYLVVEYVPTLTLRTLEVDLAEGSLTNVEYLYSQDAEEWMPLPVDLETNPIPLKFLWLLFPDDGTDTVPTIIEIHPNPLKK